MSLLKKLKWHKIINVTWLVMFLFSGITTYIYIDGINPFHHIVEVGFLWMSVLFCISILVSQHNKNRIEQNIFPNKSFLLHKVSCYFTVTFIFISFIGMPIYLDRRVNHYYADVLDVTAAINNFRQIESGECESCIDDLKEKADAGHPLSFILYNILLKDDKGIPDAYYDELELFSSRFITSSPSLYYHNEITVSDITNMSLHKKLFLINKTIMDSTEI